MALRIGILGGGFNAKFHIKALAQVRHCEVVGICSGSEQSAFECVELCREMDVGEPFIFVDVQSMASSESVQAIWICSPNDVRISNMEEIVAGNKMRGEKLRGVACEKPLARTLREAEYMLKLARDNRINTGYLENQVFSPDISAGRELVWKRAVTQPDLRPYLARCAEEHSGPHKAWFWDPAKQGGGVLNDMMCHCVLAARYLLTKPGTPLSSLIPISVTANIGSLKWSKPPYNQMLKEATGVDYQKTPAEDYAHAVIVYKESGTGRTLITECSTTWAFVGEGLRLSFEMLGPEYSMKTDSLKSSTRIFLSRNVASAAGEDMVEKQNAESGSMPVISDEAHTYGYCAEDRHMVQHFLAGTHPLLSFEDGVEVVRLLMACYKAAESGTTLLNLSDASDSLRDFVPLVAQGLWRPF